jgi:hypothetical protein
VSEYWAIARLRAEGVVTSGIVLTKSITRSSSGGNSSSPAYHVTYRFTTADGQVVPGSMEVGAATWDGLEERGPIQVRYLPRAARTHRVGLLQADYFVSLALGTAGAVATLLGGFVWWRAASVRHSSRRPTPRASVDR